MAPYHHIIYTRCTEGELCHRMQLPCAFHHHQLPRRLHHLPPHDPYGHRLPTVRPGHRTLSSNRLAGQTNFISYFSQKISFGCRYALPGSLDQSQARLPLVSSLTRRVYFGTKTAVNLLKTENISYLFNIAFSSAGDTACLAYDNWQMGVGRK